MGFQQNPVSKTINFNTHIKKIKSWKDCNHIYNGTYTEADLIM